MVSRVAISAALDAPAPFFIMGCPRSGTTLAAQLLDNHPRMAVFIESMYYTLFRADLHRYGDLRRPSNLRRLIDNFRQMVYLNGLYQVQPPSTDEIQAALPRPTFEAVLSTFLQLYALRLGKARGGEKTARHHEYLREVQATLPDSPIVFVMRDPRDTVLSIRKMFDAPLDSAVEMWRHAYRSYEGAAATVHLLRYEELVGAPHQTLRPLCEFLGDRYEVDMLEFFRNVPERLRTASHHRKLVSPINPASVGNFREMSAAEIEQIEGACREEMEAMGYVPTIARSAASGLATSTRRSPASRMMRLRGALDRGRRLLRRPDLRRLGWGRWKMRFLVRARYIVTLGPLRYVP